MAKRGYKLQEFVAHSANVNCLKIGKKTHRNFITGGDDEKVNLWSIGNPAPITSLSGHTSPIESVAFDTTELFVAAGASSGVIKLWDLEETKVVRTLNGHRSYCTAVEFHPFGEFFASGSMDTNLKIWDIRKKGCIHTYKGHKRAVSTIRFSPDGRWVVSGGLDNVVKIWDLTAGKLLHEFKFHEGHIKSMDFHPVEFLLATGSSDKTVKFWDLETFELIGTTRPEATGVRAITFHPDGRNLFCGLDSSLKVYSWEPIIVHDSVDMGWSTLGDICINDGKLIGCSYYQNSVGVWVVDTSLIEQGAPSKLVEENTRIAPRFKIQEDLKERVVSPRRSTMSSDDDTKDIKNIYVDSMTPVTSKKPVSSPTFLNLQNPKEINNLSTPTQPPAPKGQNGNSVINEPETTSVSHKASHRRKPSTTKLDMEGISISSESGLKSGPDSDKVANFQKTVLSNGDKDSSEEKPNKLKAVKYVNGVAIVHGKTRSLVERFEKREKLNTDESQLPDLPARILTDIDTPARIVDPKISPPRVKTPEVVPFEPECKIFTMPDKRPDMTKMPLKEPEAKTFIFTMPNGTEMPTIKAPEAKFTMPERKPEMTKIPLKAPEAETFTMPEKRPDVTRMPIKPPEAETFTMPEKRPNMTKMPLKAPEAETFTMPEKRSDVTRMPLKEPEAETFTMPEKRLDVTKMPLKAPEAEPFTMPERRPEMTKIPLKAPEAETLTMSEKIEKVPEAETFTMPEKRSDVTRMPLKEPEAETFTMPEKRLDVTKMPLKAPEAEPFTMPERRPEMTKIPPKAPEAETLTMSEKIEKVPDVVSSTKSTSTEAKSSRMGQMYKDQNAHNSSHVSNVQRPRTAPSMMLPEKGKASPMPRSISSRRLLIPEKVKTSQMATPRRSSNISNRITPERTKISSSLLVSPRFDTNHNRMVPEKAKSSPVMDDGPQSTGRGLMSKKDDDDVAGDLMVNHDVFLSSLRSRLTKLQVVRHFWEKNDTRGAINALRKLPDHAVQADVVNVLMERMDSLTLDLFSCLLPVLLNLLDSNTERHVSVSLELLVKLVAVFGTVVNSTISAPPAVGVDLHAEKRLECCNQCHTQLQKIHNCLPDIIRRGGLPARCAQELNIILQKS